MVQDCTKLIIPFIHLQVYCEYSPKGNVGKPFDVNDMKKKQKAKDDAAKKKEEEEWQKMQEWNEEEDEENDIEDIDPLPIDPGCADH